MDRDEDRFSGVGELPQQLDHRQGVDARQARRRLVEDEDRRIRQQLHGEVDALPLAAADAAFSLVADAGLLGAVEPELVDHRADPGLDLGVGGVAGEPEPGRVPQRLPDGEVGMEDVVLWHIPDPSAEQIVVVVEIEPADDEPAGGGDGLAVEDREERALPGAAGPHDGHHLAGLDDERDPFEEPAARGGDGDTVRLDDVAVSAGERLEGAGIGGEPVALVGDLHAGDGGDLDGPLDPPSVHERAVGAPQIADEHLPALDAHRRMERRGNRTVEGDVGRGSAAKGHQRRIVQLDRPFPAGCGGRSRQEILQRRGREAGVAERDRVADVDPLPFHAPRRHADKGPIAAPQVFEPQLPLVDDHPGMAGGDTRSLDDKIIPRRAAEEDDPPRHGSGGGWRRAGGHGGRHGIGEGSRSAGRPHFQASSSLQVVQKSGSSRWSRRSDFR